FQITQFSTRRLREEFAPNLVADDVCSNKRNVTFMELYLDGCDDIISCLLLAFTKTPGNKGFILWSNNSRRKLRRTNIIARKCELNLSNYSKFHKFTQFSHQTTYGNANTSPIKAQQPTEAFQQLSPHSCIPEKGETMSKDWHLFPSFHDAEITSYFEGLGIIFTPSLQLELLVPEAYNFTFLSTWNTISGKPEMELINFVNFANRTGT
ncbi:hypothetical protein C0J52_11977, partial [Blattella germanica]